MKYTVYILKRAEYDLAAIPRKDLLRIAESIEALTGNPRPKGTKALKGDLKNHYRVRAGDYRIVYKIEDETQMVFIVRIGHR